MLDTEELLRLLAHPCRRRILLLLTAGAYNVGDLQQALGKRQAYISQQLARLRQVEVVDCQRKGVECVYSLRDNVKGSILRGMLKLSSALQSADPGCTFVLAGRSRSELLHAVYSATRDIPCQVIDVVTYEPMLAEFDRSLDQNGRRGCGQKEALRPSIVAFALCPQGGEGAWSPPHCAHDVALALGHQGVQVVQECGACVMDENALADRKHRRDSTPRGMSDLPRRGQHAFTFPMGSQTMQEQRDV
ncbi:MAG: winged helix-turn-helix transcriptional regulator [Chloroflexi bacterium]|nr:winged helix-turn-helix transcriptional regulator [Chloroflexota bacterium]